MTVPAPTGSAEAATLDELRTAVRTFFSDARARTHPDELYGRLVRDAPVLCLDPMWLVSGFDEITGLSGRHDLSSFPSVRGQILPMTLVPSLATSLALMLPMLDGDNHSRLRGLATAAFSPGRVAQLEQRIGDSVGTILDKAVATGTMDVVTDLALPLPVMVSAALLDIPVGDRGQVYEWADLVRRQLFRYSQDDSEIELAETQLREFATYVASLCDARRRHPGDDLISVLVAAHDDGRLSNDELVAYILMLFVNGLETLTAGLTMAIWELLQHPDIRAAVAGRRPYAEAVFDEAIRLHSPVRFSARTLFADIEIGGRVVRAGDVVTLFYSAANRDARRFEDPHTFDPSRKRGRHLAFGHGTHHCLGRQLSLVTGSIVLERLAQLGNRVTTDVTPSTMQWSASLTYSTLESLPLVVTG